MNDELDKKSILEMSMGSILERVDYEMGKVIDNILDPNTKATGKRKITVSLELIPSADRKTITVQSTAKSALVPTDPITTSLFTTYDDVMGRDSLYEATCDVPDFSEGYRDYETAIVQLRSKFMPGEGVDYLLDLLSRISKENGVTTRDNGVSQEVEARQGVSLKSIVQVKPRVKLCPFRTFLEVQQPESEFILRLDEDGNVGLFEADGGMWRMTAKERICAFFEDKLAEEVSGGKVIVMM